MSEFTIGEGNIQSENLLSGQHTDARSQFIYLENELTAQGMQAGEINEIKLFLKRKAATRSDILQLKCRIAILMRSNLKTYQMIWKNVFCNTLNLNGNGWYSFSFS